MTVVRVGKGKMGDARCSIVNVGSVGGKLLLLFCVRTDIMLSMAARQA
jgi:hypothetical protein